MHPDEGLRTSGGTKPFSFGSHEAKGSYWHARELDRRGREVRLNLPVETINAPSSVPGVDFSDHASYWRFDMPAVMVTDTASGMYEPCPRTVGRPHM